jgi:hypothetical protein
MIASFTAVHTPAGTYLMVLPCKGCIVHMVLNAVYTLSRGSCIQPNSSRRCPNNQNSSLQQNCSNDTDFHVHTSKLLDGLHHNNLSYSSLREGKYNEFALVKLQHSSITQSIYQPQCQYWAPEDDLSTKDNAQDGCLPSIN